MATGPPLHRRKGALRACEVPVATARLLLEPRKSGELASNRRDQQELAVLSLHLLQAALVYINTLMIQDILADPAWAARLTDEDNAA